MTDKSLYIEEIIINSFKSLLAGRVNELLEETEYPIPPIEFGSYRGGSFTAPVIVLSTCERSEKERFVRLDAYTLTITFTVPEHPVGERNCYAYASSVATALKENPTLGGTVYRAVWRTICVWRLWGGSFVVSAFTFGRDSPQREC
ncbi:MAG: hypothetical protein LBB98_07330 [Treponema sp.]|jgi:hypothetical protein|nr:hypothetical protein [Treponema sp.]